MFLSLSLPPSGFHSTLAFPGVFAAYLDLASRLRSVFPEFLAQASLWSDSCSGCPGPSRLVDGVPEAACWFWLPGEGVLPCCIISLVRLYSWGWAGVEPCGGGEGGWREVRGAELLAAPWPLAHLGALCPGLRLRLCLRLPQL